MHTRNPWYIGLLIVLLAVGWHTPGLAIRPEKAGASQRSGRRRSSP